MFRFIISGNSESATIRRARQWRGMRLLSRPNTNSGIHAGVTTAFETNQWYAVGGSATLAPGSLMPATLLDSELVVWRDSTGAIHAWHNRCIHRGLRMTLGFVDGDHLACRYHGWRYGAGGKCKIIPAHPDMTPPDDFRIPTYAARDQVGLIWASIGTAGESVELDGLDQGFHFCRDLVVRQSPEQVAALVRRAIFRPFGDPPGDITYEYKDISPSVIQIDARSGDETTSVLLAIQPISQERTGLHVLAGGESAAERRHYADWARRLRWFMEKLDASTSSWRALSEQT
jgi:nitrite reductase/ring-hydroxylating ferredoxin subunit